jgi:hypothetical protein
MSDMANAQHVAPRDAHLSALYQASSTTANASHGVQGGVPDTVRAQVLRHAHAAVAPPQVARTWQQPKLAMAATVLLAVAVTWTLWNPTPPADRVSAPAAVTTAASVDAAAKVEAPAEASAAASPDESSAAAAPVRMADTPSPPPPVVAPPRPAFAVVAAPPMAVPPMAAIAAPESERVPPPAAPAAPAPTLAAAPASASIEVKATAARVRSPESWWQEIAALRAAGKSDEAAAEEAAFRKVYPQWPTSATPAMEVDKP